MMEEARPMSKKTDRRLFRTALGMAFIMIGTYAVGEILGVNWGGNSLEKDLNGLNFKSAKSFFESKNNSANPYEIPLDTFQYVVDKNKNY